MEELLGWGSTLSPDGCVPDADGCVAESYGRSHNHPANGGQQPQKLVARGCLAGVVESKFVLAHNPLSHNLR
jgi:hypothetical protein